MTCEPFRIEITDEVLDELRLRLRRTRFTTARDTQPWQAGVDPGYGEPSTTPRGAGSGCGFTGDAHRNSGLKQRVDTLLELIGGPDRRATATDKGTGLLAPMGLGAEKKVPIPSRATLCVHDVLAEPLPGQFVFIPEG